MLGIERRDPNRDPRKLALGSTVIGTTPAQRGKATATATLAVWLYALIGAWGLLTVLVDQVQSPSDVKTAGAAFATAVTGLVAGSLTARLRARQDGAVARRAAASDCWQRVVGAYASVVGCRGWPGRATYGGRRPCTTLRRR
jgi:hypothetical protein